MKIEAKDRLKATSLRHPEAGRRGKNQDWFNKLEESAKAEYVKSNPGTKFKARPNISAP